MRYASIRKMDISNGEGIGVALFVQGCPHRCYNCFNPETWDFNGGQLFTEQTLEEFIDLAKRPHIERVSILGGEPLANPHEMLDILYKIKQEVNKPIWVWTGYTIEELNLKQKECLDYIDYLIDGKYIDNLRNLNLKFRGSSNQRVWDIKNGKLLCL